MMSLILSFSSQFLIICIENGFSRTSEFLEHFALKECFLAYSTLKLLKEQYRGKNLFSRADNKTSDEN